MLTLDLRHFPMAPGDRVLDLGCGEGRHAIHFYLAAEVLSLGVDLSARDLATAAQRFAPFAQTDTPSENQQRGFYLQRADACQLPFADASIDKLVCSEVLEHLPDYQPVLKEIRRVIKPGGLVAISVPRAWPERLCWALSRDYHQVEGGHVRIFNGQALRRELEAQGLVFMRRHWAHALHTPYWWLRCLWWKTQEDSRLIRAYHRLLVWDLMQRPWFTRTLEKCLNPLCGKSLVMYFRAPDPKENPA